MNSVLSTNSRYIVTCLALIQLFAMAAMEMSGPFWPLYFKQLGYLSPAWLSLASGLAYAGPMVTAMLFTPLWGKFGDRVGHKAMVLRALLTLALTQLLIAYLESVWLIVLVRMIQGALAGFIAAAQAYGTQVTHPAQRAELMAKLQAATAIGSLLGPMLGGWLFAVSSFSSVNMLASLICLLCLLATMLLLPTVQPLVAPPCINPQQHTNTVLQKSPQREGSLWQSGVLGLLLGIVLVQAGKMLPQPFLALYVVEVMHASTWIVGLSYGMTALGLCLSASWWAKRFGGMPDHIVQRDIEYVLWACVLISILQAVSSNILLFLMIRLCWGICLGALLPVFYMLLSHSAGSAQGYLLGLGNSAAKAGALVGTGVGAFAMIWLPMQWLFWSLVPMYVIAAGGIRWLRTDHTPDVPEDASQVMSMR